MVKNDIPDQNSKKENELQKYLLKKSKQKLRDNLMKQISEISQKRPKIDKSVVKNIKKKKKNENFEKLIEFNQQESDQNYKNEINQDADKSISLTKSSSSCDNKPKINDCENLTKSQNDLSFASLNNDQSSHFMTIEASTTDKEAIVDSSRSANNEISIEELNTKSKNIRQQILELKEIFTVNQCLKRSEEMQSERAKLDIFYSQDEIKEMVKFNLITFIQGETGCGKTTQIPQFLYENGFCNDGIIGITQPRRLSAIAISARINSEMNENLSGFHIKFENNIESSTKIKIMTEGILFKEISSDFCLMKYSVIILDEVHERSSLMDLLIGLLSKIIKVRFKMKNPLRLILMSASVDSNSFKPVLGDFATCLLKTKSFKINVFYEIKTPENYLEAIFIKIKDILDAESNGKNDKKQAGKNGSLNGIENTWESSILVFLTSKEDIHNLQLKLQSISKAILVLPLHSKLSKYDQNKVFEKLEGHRKIVLATNIAETSITIPDIVFVIDSGLVKTKIMDQSTILYKIQYIAKSNAKQRMGRAGRTRDGVCFRIYSGDTYESFTDFNTPQIYVESFESHYLNLKNLGIGNISKFPFISHPTDSSISDTIESLISLGGLSKNGSITEMGRLMCGYPISPRYSKILINNQDDDIFYLLCIIVSILSTNFELKIKKHHLYFINERSDLIVSLKVFLDYLKSNKKQKFCKSIDISYEILEEIRKLSVFLMRVSGKTEFSTELSDSIKTKLHIVLYEAFLDQVAVVFGKSYIFKNGEVFVSSDSIQPKSKFVVFDHIVCGKNKSYIRNITEAPNL